LYLLSDSEPLEENLDLPINDDGKFDNLFNYCFAKMEMELDGWGELIGEEAANTLYG